MQTSAKTGALWIVGAVLLNVFPWFGGPGWIWSLALLGGAAWIWSGRANQAFLVAWTLAVCAHALDNFYIGLGALPWLVGAVFCVRAIWTLFDPSKIWRGYAPYAVIGALLCLWTPFWTWGRVAGWSSSMWMGGLDLNTHISPVTGDSYLGLDYNATKWLMPMYSPGYDFSGRALAGAFNASLVTLAILGWVLWRDQTSRHRTRLLPLLGSAFLLVWALPALKSGYNGPWAFVMGALGIGFCALMALRGAQAGQYDLTDVAGRVRRRVNQGKRPPNSS